MIIGAGGFGREVIDVARAALHSGDERFELLGVVDDSPSDVNLMRLAALGIPYLGREGDFPFAPDRHSIVVAIGNPTTRARVAARFAARGITALTLVHPSATVGSQSFFGPGTIVCAGVQVSTNVLLGEHVHLNPAAVIGHDTVIGDMVSVNPGAVVSGDVVIAPGVLVGASSVVLQGLTLGAGSTVGAGACVTHDVGPECVVKGVPAR